MRSKGRLLMLVALGTILCAGLVLAEPARPRSRRMEPGTGPARGAARGQALGFLLARGQADVELNEIPEGVELVLTTDPDRADALRERIEGTVAGLQQAAEHVGPRFPVPREGRGPALVPLVLAGEVELDTESVPEGLVVRITTEDEELRDRLQEQIPEWLERARQRREEQGWMMRQRRHARWGLRLIAEEEVELDVDETDDGVLISVRSDDPETVEALHEHMPQMLEGLKDFATRMRERRGFMQERAGRRPMRMQPRQGRMHHGRPGQRGHHRMGPREFE